MVDPDGVYNIKAVEIKPDLGLLVVRYKEKGGVARREVVSIPLSYLRENPNDLLEAFTADADADKAV